MKRRKKSCRWVASLLTAALVLGNIRPGFGSIAKVQAASDTYTPVNFVTDGGFESEEEFTNQEFIKRWSKYPTNASVTRVTDEFHSGSKSIKLDSASAALEQDFPEMIVGQTYILTFWGKLSGEQGDAVHKVGVKNYGGEDSKVITSTDWQEYSLEFTYSDASKTPRVYAYVQTKGNVASYVDDITIVAKSDIQRAKITNGAIEITFGENYEGDLTADKFSATYKSSIAPDEVKELVLSAGLVEESKLTLDFTAIEAKPVAQTITVNLTYGKTDTTPGETITLEYTVAANGEEEVIADIQTVTADNSTGTVSIVLTEDPTVRPAKDNFTLQYKLDGEGQQWRALSVKDFTYDAENATITLNYPSIRGLTDREATVSLKVTYLQKEKDTEFILPQSQANTYYVSVSGNATNDGLSEEKPLPGIDALNDIVFYPGDQILFKKGDTFVGCFKPQGSGTKENPITIGAYGEGEERPVLQPGENFRTYVMSAGSKENNVEVNYVIWFYNVSYWEVSDLELEDPKHETTYKNPGMVYRCGITIQGKDCGTLEHIYVDNMVIHGFHGPKHNLGKSSGGIMMNVITNYDMNISQAVKTQINDIRITNCEIYDVGRSGINFLTPWAYRPEEKWGLFAYGNRAFEYFPYEDFYMGNNYIHDIDADGTIIDNCRNAVSEYNLVTRCVKYSSTPAVGLFNWNSDNTVFQYNEVYDIQHGQLDTDPNRYVNDCQGIEIDALNDKTWVQYNYVHDNHGGFMMLCNVGDGYRSFDGIIRYNISQDDYTHPRQGMFDIYAANWGTEIYNNNFYFTDRAKKDGEIFLFSTIAAREPIKFYNNIFYYEGEEPATVNTFGDNINDWQSNIFSLCQIPHRLQQIDPSRQCNRR